MKIDKKDFPKKSKHSHPVLKRLFDFFVSLFIILLLSWLILIVLFLNLIMTLGRPFYFDVRVGYHGKTIKILKFTTMKKNANENAELYFTEEQKEDWKNERKVDNDPRVTKFGRILRKTSIDELPQLFNILFGSLSFVGPRPITEQELEMHFTKEQQIELLSVKPGLTGNWATSGRNNVEYQNGKRQELELEYADNATIKNDLKIIRKTFKALFDFNAVK